MQPQAHQGSVALRLRNRVSQKKLGFYLLLLLLGGLALRPAPAAADDREPWQAADAISDALFAAQAAAVSYTHLRAHETVLDLVCRLLLEKKQTQTQIL